MAGFSIDQSLVTCDGVALSALAERERTPLYIYSASLIIERCLELDQAFGDYPHRVHYALKANSTLAIARLIQGAGAGVDANSGGEIEVALRAGFQPQDIVFTGVGKSEAELEHAIAVGVHVINAESSGELERINRLACARGIRVPVALRVNPDVQAGGHPYISTGQKSHKFGVPITGARELYRRAVHLEGLELVGVHAHIGSQIVKLGPLRKAADAVVMLARELADDGIRLSHIDLGGGLGISYDGSAVPSASDYASLLVDAVRDTGFTVLVEPGRWIVGPAGVLVASVVDVKPGERGQYFVVLDAGMSELLRPALYGAFHRIVPLEPRSGTPVTCDIVGPICETSDVVGVQRTIPLPNAGDLVAVFDAGAYGSTMASNYNRHPLPAEVMVKDGAGCLVRRRQSFDDLVALET